MEEKLFDIPADIPLMPEEYKGKLKKGCGYTKSAPREWTDKEVEYLKMLCAQGHSDAYIATSMDRTEVSIHIKRKRLGKVSDKYNQDHRTDKYTANAEFLKLIKPQTVLDLYAGQISWWQKNGVPCVESNDKNQTFCTSYHEPAELLVHKLYYERRKYDLVDIDPFGTAYDCLELGIRMAMKGIVITYGEMGHKRWKRLDFVRTHWGIEHLEDFTTKSLIEETQRIAARCHKVLTPVIVKEWKQISRVYYTIQTLKFTEQWQRERRQ